MTKPVSERHATIESLKERIARDPLSRAFLQLAEEYRREGRYQEAVRVCLEGLERHPTYHTARISLGRTHMEAGDLANARRAFADVLELQPENHLAGKLLAEVQKKTSDLAGAAETYRTILRYYPGDREVQGLLSEAMGGSVATRAAAATVSAVPPAPPRAAPPAAPAVMAPRRAVDPAVDLQAGDLDGAGLAAGESAGGSTGPWAGAPAGTVGEDDAGDRDDALQTNTLAELYLRQGLVDRAVEVYRSMLRVDPDNQKAARRFADLTRTTGPPGAVPDPGAAARTEKPPTVAATNLERPVPVAAPPAGPEARGPDARIHRLESWLKRMRSGSAREANTR